MPTPLDCFKFKKLKLLLWLIPVIIIFVLAILYVFGWSQSNFKCLNFSRPIQYPLNAGEQIKACTSFKDLDNFRVEATNAQLGKIIAEKKKSGGDVGAGVAAKYVFGRAKIEEYARRNNISVSGEEEEGALGETMQAAGGEDILLRGTSMDAVKAQLRGYILQKKVEAAAVNYRIADFVALRWDWTDPKIWTKNWKALQAEATKDLQGIGESLKKGLSPEEAAKTTEVDQTKFGFNFGTEQELTKANVKADVYVKALKLPIGVSNVICDERFCAVFRVLVAHKGQYSSMEEFMGGLLGW